MPPELLSEISGMQIFKRRHCYFSDQACIKLIWSKINSIHANQIAIADGFRIGK